MRRRAASVRHSTVVTAIIWRFGGGESRWETSHPDTNLLQLRVSKLYKSVLNAFATRSPTCPSGRGGQGKE